MRGPGTAASISSLATRDNKALKVFRALAMEAELCWPERRGCAANHTRAAAR